MTTVPNYYTVTELSTLVGKSAKTIRRWIQSGKIKAELQEGEFGPEYRISREEAERVEAMYRARQAPGEQGEGVQSRGQNDDDQVTSKDGYAHVDSSDEPNQILLPIPIWETTQKELRGAIFKAGQLEGENTELRRHMQGLQTEKELLQKRISELEEKLETARSEKDTKIDELISAWRQTAVEKQEETPEKKGFFARLFGR